jgi:hypothetical protein
MPGSGRSLRGERLDRQSKGTEANDAVNQSLGDL